jgi:hypothetical protein
VIHYSTIEDNESNCTMSESDWAMKKRAREILLRAFTKEIIHQSVPSEGGDAKGNKMAVFVKLRQNVDFETKCPIIAGYP